MNPWVVVPAILPAIVAPLIVLFLRNRPIGARIASIASCTALLGLAVALAAHASTGAVESYELGDWPAPFGIVLVLDRLSALMLVLTAILALACTVYAGATGLDRKGRHFHALLQFQLLGLNGAFLTGDLFNLFVFFEVLLIASYGLMLHGGGRARLKAGLQYVVINLVGSALFLAAVGLLYGITGTLNMADMALKVRLAGPGDQGLLAAGALLLTSVFALKAAIAPLHFWLPRTYASTSAPVAALFLVMTKVGAYAIIRCTTLIFGEGAGAAAWAPAPWLLGAALVTGVMGFLGVVAARGLREMAAYAVVGSMGTLMAAVAVFRPEVMAAALYYLVHSSLAGAALFLLADMIAVRRRDYADVLAPAPPFKDGALLSGAFLLTAVGVVGLPPLSGFIGKLLILDAIGAGSPAGVGIWSMVLGTTLLAMFGFARAGSVLFWSSEAMAGEREPDRPPNGAAAISTQAALLGLLVALSVAAGPVTDYMQATSAQLFRPADYLSAVLGQP